MIHVPRTVPEPAVLQARNRRGQTEIEQVIAKAEQLITDAGLDISTAHVETIVGALQDLRHDFSLYKRSEVKDSLTAIFLGKCAYCESMYASTQPMDVEHHRPKAGVQDERTGALLRPGYYWLASSWLNLLPSCIDCNRVREQMAGTWIGSLGKGNRFPLEPGTRRMRWHNDGDIRDERPLLLDPCVDDPQEHLLFLANGTVDGLSDRGRVSIDIYGLGRSGLVWERRHRARIVEFRLDMLASLSLLRLQFQQDGTVRPGWVELVEELVLSVGQQLDRMGDAAEPYAGMARQLIARGTSA